MPKRKLPANTWTWRLGAIDCTHRRPSPFSSRVRWCGLCDKPRRCMRATCVEVGEAKRVINEGKVRSQPNETTGQLLAAEANRQIQARLKSVMPVVYICHPLTGDGSPEWGNFARNIERYLRFVAWAELDGKAVLSWVHHPLLFERHLTPTDEAFYLDRDCVILARADIVYMCGPVAVSKGMQREKACAEQHGIPILHKPIWDNPSFNPFQSRPLPF